MGIRSHHSPSGMTDALVFSALATMTPEQRLAVEPYLLKDEQDKTCQKVESALKADDQQVR